MPPSDRRRGGFPMSMALSSRWSWKRALPWVGLGLAMALLAANLMHDLIFHGRPLGASPARPKVPAPPRMEPASGATVTLPEGKLKAAGLRTEPTRVVALPTEVGVAGRI